MIIGKSLTALGGGGLKPEITVTAKAGALLNLHYKDSSIILKSYQLGAEETQHTFVVNVSETAYVVEDVTNNESVEILVDAVAVFDVKIPYILWIYKAGDECEEVTGGWNYKTHSASGGRLVKEADHFQIYCNGSDGVIYTKNSLPLSEYDRMMVEYELVGITSNAALFGAWSTVDDGIAVKTVHIVLQNTVQVPSPASVEIEKTATGTNIIYAANTGTGYFRINNIWLE